MKTYSKKTDEKPKIPDNEGKTKSKPKPAAQFKDNRPQTIAQQKLSGIADKHLQKSPTLQKKSNETIQLKGDRYYWVRPNGGSWTYVGAFKSHAEANQWWAENKSSYPDGEFSQGNSKTKFK